LQCTLCNIIIKNQILWEKHIKSTEHIESLKVLKESLLKKAQNKKESPLIVKEEGEKLEKISDAKEEKSEAIKIEKSKNEIICPKEIISSKQHIVVEEKKPLKNILQSMIEIKNKEKSLPCDFFDNPILNQPRNKEELSKTNTEIKTAELNNTNLTIEESKLSLPQEEESENESIINEEVEAMVECSEFIQGLIKPKKKKKFERIMQINSEETLKEERSRFLNKKRRLLDFNIDNTEKEGNIEEDLFGANWKNS
jgi:hypothetical protein